MSDKPLAAALKAARKRKGISIRELGRRSDIQPMCLSRWERGTMPLLRLLPLIAKTYGISEEILWTLRSPRLAAQRLKIRQASTSTPLFKRL